MAVKPVWSVVREILSTNISLTADEVIAKARATGVKAPDDVIRTTVHNVRKKLKKKAAAPAVKPAPAAARQTAAPSASAVVRAVLAADLDLPADAVIARAKAKGVTAPDASIRNAVHNVRSEMKKAAPAPNAAATKPKPAPAAVAAAPSAPSLEVAGVLSNVALVNAAVAASGGVDAARQVAEAVRACGGPDQFAQYLDLVAGIRTG